MRIMEQNRQENSISGKLQAYKRKYYTNMLVKGSIITLALLTTFFLLANSLEFALRFNSWVRGFILLSFIGTTLFTLIKYVITPITKLIDGKNGISNEEAALQIGKYFPSVKDRLLNLIQLQHLDTQNKDNSLISASIHQKSDEIGPVAFTEAIDIKENLRYAKYLAIPLVLIVTVMLWNPGFFSSSTGRILQFNKEFVRKAPFRFDIENKGLRAFKNEDFELKLVLSGEAFPEHIYLVQNGRKIKMRKDEQGHFSYLFQKVQNDKQFYFEGAGFRSVGHELDVVHRPNLKQFSIALDYPDYLGKKKERLDNIGNIEVPEGTLINWQFQADHTENFHIKFPLIGDSTLIQENKQELFEYERRMMKSQPYEVGLTNEYSGNKDKIIYNINVIPDRHPEISLETFQDTTLYSFMILGGNIADDYGLQKLRLYYQIDKKENDTGKNAYVPIDIPIDRTKNSQGFYYQWQLDSLSVGPGEELHYYLQVWDNDGINGSKASKTGVYTFKIPDEREAKENIEKSTAQTEEKIDNTLKKAKDIEESIDKVEERLKGKKNLDWQDENLLKEIVEKREELNKTLEELKEQFKDNTLKRERFTEKEQKIAEKAKQLQELMDELLDEETKKLYDELQKLLEEKNDIGEMQDVLEKLDNKEDNLEKELERTLELFKRMKFEYKLDETIKALEEQAEKQEELSEQTGDKSEDKEELQEKQEELQQQFEELQKDMEEMKELNQEMKSPESLPDQEELEKDTEQQQQESKESLEKDKRKKAQESQKKAAENMKKMAQQMKQMQGGMEMQMMQENLDHLRDIVHNLLKLSFDEEKLLEEFKKVDQSDPRFITLSQQQLKLQDDAKIVEDSLLSLAGRVFQIQSFVTREVGEMNEYMEASTKAIKDRKKGLATSKQQYAMTSMNNLALLLDDVLQQMQQSMKDAMGSPQKGKGKPQEAPSLSELQKQLNQKISDLKKSGKKGRSLSEELSKLASEQERIRKAMQEMQQKMGGKKGGSEGTGEGEGKGEGEEEGGSKPGDGIPEKMEETETDLVNKRITEETIKRQQDILTRLLQAEDALREREQDEERKGETAKQYEKAIPKAFEEYLKLKEKEIELLKTVPPKLFPYYKKEVNDYFKRVGENVNN